MASCNHENDIPLPLPHSVSQKQAQVPPTPKGKGYKRVQMLWILTEVAPSSLSTIVVKTLSVERAEISTPTKTRRELRVSHWILEWEAMFPLTRIFQ